jgi:N,N'-diacetylchitobiose transport system permease protein
MAHAPTLDAPKARSRSKRRRSGIAGRSRTTTGLANLIGLGFVVVMAFPVYWMVLTAFKSPTEILTFHPNFLPLHPTLDNFKSAINAPYFLTDMRNSLVITAVAVVAGVVVGFLGALALARFRFAGRRVMIILLLAVQMVPLITVIIPIYLLLNKYHLTNTLPGVILVYIVLILPFTIWMLRGFIANVPRELDEAALVDGCTRWQMFYKILLPLTLPGVVSAAIYGFIQAWNEFFIINILTQSGNKANLMVWLTSNQTQHGTFWGPLMAGATLTSIPVVVFFLIIQKNVATGLTAGAVKG